jgi:MFS family permease
MSEELPTPGHKLTSAAPLYSVSGIVIGTVLGSLAAAIVMLNFNYRALGHQTLARKVAIWGSVVYLLLILLTAQIPPSMTVNLAVVSVQALIAYFASSTLQGAAISYHREHQGPIHSGWRAAGVGLLTGMTLLMMLWTATIIIASLTGELPLPTAEDSGLPS